MNDREQGTRRHEPGGPRPALSAFSPLEFTFSMLERDFSGTLLPLLAAGALATADWTVLSLGLIPSGNDAVALLAVWTLPSCCFGAGMLDFCARIARRKPYSWRGLARLDRTVIGLAVLKLAFYGGVAASGCLVQAMSGSDAEPASHSLGGLLGTVRQESPPGPALQGLVWLALVAVWVVVLVRTAIAPVLVAVEGMGPATALASSVRWTRGNAKAIGLYGVALLLLVGMGEALFTVAVAVALGAPGLVYLGLNLAPPRSERTRPSS